MRFDPEQRRVLDELERRIPDVLPMRLCVFSYWNSRGTPDAPANAAVRAGHVRHRRAGLGRETCWSAVTRYAVW